MKDKMMNKKYVSNWRTALGIATVSLGSIVAMIQPASANHRWVSGRSGSVPAGAIPVGNDGGDTLYACRANNTNGKLHSRYGKCYVPYGGREQEFTTYEVLVGNNLRWVPLTGAAPQYAVVGGNESNGTPLYVCRAGMRSGVTPGKYNAVNSVCYVPYGGKENEIRSGEILLDEPVASTTPQNYPAGIKYLLANNDALKKAITKAWNEGGKGIAQQKISEALGNRQISEGVSIYGQNVNLGDIQSRGVEFNPNTNQVILQVYAPGKTEFLTTTPTIFGSYGDPRFEVGFDLNVTIKISTATNKVNIDDITIGVVGTSFKGKNAVATVFTSVKNFITNGQFSRDVLSKINGSYSAKDQLVGNVKSAIGQYVPANILNQ